MAKIKFLREPKARKDSDWALVAKLWPHKTKKDSMSGRFGVKTKGEGGALVDTFESIQVSADDPIMIRPNLNRRDDKNDPTFLVYMLKEGAKPQAK